MRPGSLSLQEELWACGVLPPGLVRLGGCERVRPPDLAVPGPDANFQGVVATQRATACCLVLMQCVLC
jgi:hypothetical protein